MRPQSLKSMINDNERFRKKSSSMTMTLKGYGVREEKLAEREVDGRAECLVEMFSAPGSKPLYCDAVRYLTKGFLDEKAKLARERGKNPAKYFGTIIYNKLRDIGVYH